MNISIQELKNIDTFLPRFEESCNLIWLDERVFVYNLWSTIFPNEEFVQKNG